MITRLINNPSQAGGLPALPKLAEESILPLPIPQPIATPLGIRTSHRVAPLGLHRQQAFPVQAETVSKPRVLENVEIAQERAVPDYGSSGSDHDPSSVSLFAMVHEFIENDGNGEQQRHIADGNGGLDNSKDTSKVNGAAEMLQVLQGLVICSDSIEDTLLRDTQKILQSVQADVIPLCDDGKPATVTHSCLKRMVMSLLQEKGYNAALCKTRWEHLCSIPAGDYEYIDVLISASGEQSECLDRLIIDIDFESQFEIARPTEDFIKIRKLLPSIFVGRAERLKRVVHIMSEATKLSLKLKGLHLPPWRKPAYMKAKWFSAYKRTTNASPGHSSKEKMSQHVDSLGLAVRGGVLDAKYTNILELLYHQAGSNFLVGEDRDIARQRERDQITVVATDWQPPMVAPRPITSRKQGTKMGLSYLLMRCPPSSRKEMIIQAA